MSEILKSQIHYYKYYYISAWGFTLLLAAVLLLTGVEPAYLITMGGSTVMIILFSILMGVNSDKEKQYRMLVLLPRKISEISKTQIMLVLILFAGVVILWFITYCFQSWLRLTDAVIQIIAYCSYLINWIFFFWILGDLTHAGKYYLKIVFVFLVFSYILAAILIGSYFGVGVIAWFTLSDTHPETLPELISMVFLSIILIITEYNIFIKRKSYLT